MTRPRLYPMLMLLAVFLAACAPAATAVAPAQPELAEPSATLLPEPTPESSPAVELEPTALPTTEVLPAATSRGPDLYATDPSTVSLASGGLQLVEFFRFT